ncbi:MAG: heat-inducible transcriptional repressor HrcA [Gammaproteobacteria bacterium]
MIKGRISIKGGAAWGLDERSQHLLKILVERYIAGGQPLGSRTLARHAKLELSPATIRNVMADLEDMGLVCSPHTSAGRMPTNLGYRFFVDSLLRVKDLREQEVERLAYNLGSEPDIKGLVRKTSSVLSEFTRLVSVVMVPRKNNRALEQVEFLPLTGKRVLLILVLSNDEIENRIIKTDREYTRIELEQAANYINQTFSGRGLGSIRSGVLHAMSAVRHELDRLMQTVIDMAERAFGDAEDDEDDYVLAGETHLMGASELADIEMLRRLFEAFNQKRDILHLLDQALKASGVQIFIGEELGYEALGGCSAVTSTYESNGAVLGVLAVIGPTRMPYQRVIPIVDLAAKALGSALKSFH